MRLLLFALLITVISSAQPRFGETRYTAFNMGTDPNALISDDVFVMSLEVERVETGFYFKGGFEYASLEGDYKFIYTALGINLKYGHFDDWRYYAGIKSGFVFRGGEYVNFGPEIGINYDFDNGIMLGLRADYIYRGDWLYWEGDPDWQGSGYIILIIKIN